MTLNDAGNIVVNSVDITNQHIQLLHHYQDARIEQLIHEREKAREEAAKEKAR